MEITKEINSAIGYAIKMTKRAALAETAYRVLGELILNYDLSDLDYNEMLVIDDARKALDKLSNSAFHSDILNNIETEL